MSDLFSDPMVVSDPQECFFYHTLELPVSGLQIGQWDLRGRFDDYTLGVPLAGKTVLDVGTASGFLSFEAEKRGATVVSVEAASTARWERLPFAQSLWFKDRSAWEAIATDHLDSIKRSYWLAHRELGSQARVYYGDAYDLPASLGLFDVVIVGQILVHLRDVIRAVTSISRRCADTLIIAEGMVISDEPTSLLIGRADDQEKDNSFWFHSIGLYREILAMLEFRLMAWRTLTYTCNVERNPLNTPVTTLVFRRVGPGTVDRPALIPATKVDPGSHSTPKIEPIWQRLKRRLSPRIRSRPTETRDVGDHL
jgi:SAM-dependent methyltransferase